MKTATILPPKYLHLIKDEPYHMCLAHLIKDRNEFRLNGDEYTFFYQCLTRQKDKYVIMDNGVVEGDQRPIDEIVKKALFVGAHEIILPDVMLDQSATLKESYRALKWVKDNFPLRIMAVPQGKTLDEWVDCAIAMIDWDIDCIGVPKILTKIGGRDARLEVLSRLGNKLRGLDIHLLGCWNSALELTMIERAVQDKQIRPVRGVDSALPFIYAKAGVQIDESDRPNVGIHFNETDVDTNLIETNIRLWKDAATINLM